MSIILPSFHPMQQEIDHNRSEMERKEHEEFAAFLKKASEEVDKWPEWKKNCLGRRGLD